MMEMEETMKREKFATQLGFILTTAGGAIGLGNIYRFPYIVGQYGGAVFVLLYLACLILVGLPLVAMELAVGRASGASTGKAFEILAPDKKGWQGARFVPIVANYVYNMFYTTITAQMLYYAVVTLTGKFSEMDTNAIRSVSENLEANPKLLILLMTIVVVSCFMICMNGLTNSVEKASKYMLTFLLVIMVVLVFRSAFLEGFTKGMKFYLYPDFSKFQKYGFKEILSAALGQAFFTLGIGAGSICICGSYMDRKQRLVNQASKVVLLDLFVALMAGMIIFPACFTYGIEPEVGPDLLVLTMPNVFNTMSGGRIWGSLFFLAVLMATVTTVVASFENIVGTTMDMLGWSRKKAALMNILPMILLSLPCIFGMNIWSHIRILGKDIMGIEDFIVSNCLLPIGSLIYVLFCVTRYGWGFQNFRREANEGVGIEVPNKTHFYLAYILPVFILILFIIGFTG